MPEIRCKKCKHELKLKEIAFFCPVCGASPYDLKVKTSPNDYSPLMDNVVLSEGRNIERIAWEISLPANAEKKVRLFNIEFAGDNNGNINVYAINPVNTTQKTQYKNPIPSGLASISYLVLAPVYLYIFGQGAGGQEIKRVNYLSWLYKEEANVENIGAYHDAGLASSPSIFFYKNIPYLVYLTGPTQITLLPAVKKRINANNINFPDNIVSFCGDRENLYVVLNNAYYRVDVENQIPEEQENIPATRVPQYCFVDDADVNIR